MTSATKLAEARQIVGRLAASDTSEDARAAFGQAAVAISASRARMESESKKRARSTGRRERVECDDYWREISRIVGEDDLLSWAERSRHENAHVEMNGPAVGIAGILSEALLFEEPLPSEGIEIRGDGLWFVENRGTPWESRRSPQQLSDFVHKFVSNDPPSHHFGAPLESTSPVDLLLIVVEWHAGLWATQIQRWPERT